jgi:hypothetical protein
MEGAPAGCHDRPGQRWVRCWLGPAAVDQASQRQDPQARAWLGERLKQRVVVWLVG